MADAGVGGVAAGPIVRPVRVRPCGRDPHVKSVAQNDRFSELQLLQCPSALLQACFSSCSPFWRCPARGGSTSTTARLATRSRRSLLEHGDVVIRDPDVWYPILPGPDGKTYTNYRLPHSLLGVPALALADLCGPPSEARRHFYFVLLRAVGWGGAGGSVRGLVRRPRLLAALGRLMGGGRHLLHAELVLLHQHVRRHLRGDDGGARPDLGLAEPRARVDHLGVAGRVGDRERRSTGNRHWPSTCCRRWRRRGAGRSIGPEWLRSLAESRLGSSFTKPYEWLRFPPGYERPAIKYNPPIWNATPLAAAVALIVSPSCGAIWYCPPVVLGFAGLMRSLRSKRCWALSVLIACGGFFASICLLAFFKGNIAWGPRYLTPVFAVLWLFTPSAAAVAGRFRTGLVLGLGIHCPTAGAGDRPASRLHRQQCPARRLVLRQRALLPSADIASLRPPRRNLGRADQRRRTGSGVAGPVADVCTAAAGQRPDRSVRRSALSGFFQPTSLVVLAAASRPGGPAGGHRPHGGRCCSSLPASAA